MFRQLSASSSSLASPLLRAARGYATATGSKAHHKVVIVGGGTAGTTVAAQLRRSREAQDYLQKDDIAIIDKADVHSYQPGWTLVGTGLRSMSDMRRPMTEVIPSGVQHYPMQVAEFSPDSNSIKTAEGFEITYDYLVVAPGLKTDFGAVKGLEAALANSTSNVSSIYSEPSAEQTWRNIQAFEGGDAIFTQPAGVFKCAGAPQKVLWMALSQWKLDGKRDQVRPTFATGAPSMFAVPKYSKALEQLRVERNVEGLFQHNLTAVDSKRRIATFKDLANKKDVERPYNLLHVVPPQKPHDFVAKSPLADPASGWVSVDQFNTRHTKYENVFSIGDASSLPNSKTAAAVSAQAPVLVDNLLATMRGDKTLSGRYDGYASCPLLTGHDELMLAEFKYGGVPKETFEFIAGSQAVPRKAFYHLKKDIFPAVYWNAVLKGTWYGPSGLFRPNTSASS